MLFFSALALALGAATATAQLNGLLGNEPTVTLDYGTFQGTSAFEGVDSFLGIPFAKAGRLQNPTVMSAANKLNGVQDATKYGAACPQQELVSSPLNNGNAEIGALLGALEQIAFNITDTQSEDCLFVNVQIPSGLNSTAGLPVMYWIFGGGYELGSASALGSEATLVNGLIYQGASIVQRSIQMGQPLVFVSANYRLNAFGGLASEEINEAGVPNLILKDQ